VLQKFNGLIGISVTAFTSVSGYKMTRINGTQHYTFNLPVACLSPTAKCEISASWTSGPIKVSNENAYNEHQSSDIRRISSSLVLCPIECQCRIRTWLTFDRLGSRHWHCQSVL